MAPECEEVVVNSDAFELKNIGEDLAQRDLVAVSWSAVTFDLSARCRQRTPVQLSVGCDRKAVQKDESRGDHVIRKPLAKIAAKDRGARCIVPCGHDVSHELLAPGSIIARDHDGLRHLWVRRQGGLDFTQLDPEAADLDLVVNPSQEFDRAVAPPPRQIPRSIHPLAKCDGVRISHESLGRQSRTPVITARQPRSGDVQIAGHAHGNRLHLPVQNVHPSIPDRRTDRRRGITIIFATRPCCYVDGRLRWPVEIVQFNLGQPREESRLKLSR